jgi:transposase
MLIAREKLASASSTRPSRASTSPVSRSSSASNHSSPVRRACVSASPRPYLQTGCGAWERPHLAWMARSDLTDRQWRRLEPLLPPQRPRTGRPNHDHRRIINGILWVLRTGAPWGDLPERYGPVGTVSSRFYRWRGAGIWDRLLAALQTEADARGEVDWDLHFVDATIVRAHQHAAGARRIGAVGG